MICPLCQYDFEETIACRGCGLYGNCRLLRCPKCCYEFVAGSATLEKVGGWVKKVKGWIRKEKGHENKRKRRGADISHG